MQCVTWVAVRYNTSTCQSTCLWDILIRSCADINSQWVAVRYNTSTCLSTLFWVVLIMSMYTHACLYISTEINNSQWVAVRYMSCSALQHVDFPVNLLMRYSNTIMRWHQLTVSCSELQWVAVRCNASTCQSTLFWDVLIATILHTYACLCISAEIKSRQVAVCYIT